MKLLITGGMGFIGSAVVRQAVAAGHEVVVLDALTYAGNPANVASVADAIAFEHVDLRHRERVLEVVQRHAPEGVVHLAAESHVDRSIDDPTAVVTTNVLGLQHLLDALGPRWRGKLVVVSTDEVYGDVGDAPFTEASPYAPRNPYAASKAAADHLARAAFHTFGVPVVVTHGANTFGPYQFPEKLVPVMLLNALSGRPLPVYGDGLQAREWLYVEDHAAGILAALAGTPGRSYNLGSGVRVRNLDLVRQLCRLLDERRPGGAPHEALLTFVADRPGHDRGYALDVRRAEAELGWTTTTGFDEGLVRTVDWFLANEAWWRPLLERLPLGTRLGTA